MPYVRIVVAVLLGTGSGFSQELTISPAFYYATPPYPPFPGARLNDASSCGTAAGTNNNAIYTVAISEKGAPDSFRWRKDDGPMSPPVGISGTCQTVVDGIGIRFGRTTGHSVPDQWAIMVTVSGTAQQVVNQRSVGPVIRTAESKLRELLLGSDFAVDPSGQADSTAGLQAGINQSRVSGQCLKLGGGTYRLSGSGLLLSNGQCIEADGNSQVTLLMTTDNMTALTVQGYHNKVKGFLLTKSTGVTGGIGVMVNTSSSVDRGNTVNNQIEDMWIVADDPVGNLLTAGVEILSGSAGEVVFTHMRNIHVQGAQDGIWINSPNVLATHFQSNANWCTDCHLENSRRCLHITSTGENHFDGLSLNGCNAQGNTGTISVTNGSTAVVGAGTEFGTWRGSTPLNGAPLYAAGFNVLIASNEDAMHLTLAAPWPGATARGLTYAVGLAPIVLDAAPDHYPVQGNFISWNTGEPARPVVVFDRYSEGNTVVSSNFAPLGATSIDLSNGKNAILSPSGSLLPSYDLNGFPQLWIGQVQAHTAQQHATFQISETSPPGKPGAGNNDIMRIQKAADPQHAGPLGSAWLDFNPYANGLYLDSAPSYRGSALKLDTGRTDAYVSGSIDFMHHGQPWANIKAVVPNSAYTATELHLSTISGSGGSLADQGAIAARIKNRQFVSLGPISNGACASGTMTVTGAVVGDSVAPAWPVEVFAAKVLGSMVVSSPNTITINVCNLSGKAVTGNAFYGATVVR